MEPTTNRWIDTHCHLDALEFAKDRDVIVEQAVLRGVDRIVIPSVEVRNFTAVADCVTGYERCYAAYGIHPLYVAQAQENALESLRNWLEMTRASAHAPVAVGEIGLDAFVPGADMARQEFFFCEQLELARDYDLPVLLHLRAAQDLVLKNLRKIFGDHYRRSAGIAHAFSGSRQQAEAFIALGFKLGFGGAATYLRATRLRRLLTELPIEAIVLETDAPDIAPVFVAKEGPRRNEPAHLAEIATILAEVRGMAIDDFARNIEQNTLLALPGLRV